MEFFDMNGEEFALVRLITQKLAENITDLEEDSIYEIIRGDFNSKFNGFYRIYEEIHNNVYAEINENGETDLDPEAIFKIFGHLSDKIPLERTSHENQLKLFAFLKMYGDYCRTDSNKAKTFGHKINNLVTNGFFIGENRAKLLNIILDYKVPVSTNLLYEFAVRGFNITPFFSNLSQYDVASLKEEILFKLGVISYHMAKSNP
jgi:hypothetical protein